MCQRSLTNIQLDIQESLLICSASKFERPLLRIRKLLETKAMDGKLEPASERNVENLTERAR